MAISLESISNAKRVRAPRIVLLGTPGIGKSEFASGAEDVIFFPIKGEEGIDDLDVDAFPVLDRYEDVLGTIGLLYEGEHLHKTLVIDSATTLAPLVDAQALVVEGVASKSLLGGGYGHQYDRILELWRDILNGLDALRNDRNMTIVLIGHVKIRSSRDPDVESFDQWAFDVDGKVADMLIRWSDCTLFMGRKTIVKQSEGGFGKKEKKGVDITGGQRWLFTQQSPTHPGKCRGFFSKLPAELPLPRDDAWSAFMLAVGSAASA